MSFRLDPVRGFRSVRSFHVNTFSFTSRDELQPSFTVAWWRTARVFCYGLADPYGQGSRAAKPHLFDNWYWYISGSYANHLYGFGLYMINYAIEATHWFGATQWHLSPNQGSLSQPRGGLSRRRHVRSKGSEQSCWAWTIPLLEFLSAQICWGIWYKRSHRCGEAMVCEVSLGKWSTNSSFHIYVSVNDGASPPFFGIAMTVIGAHFGSMNWGPLCRGFILHCLHIPPRNMVLAECYTSFQFFIMFPINLRIPRRWIWINQYKSCKNPHKTLGLMCIFHSFPTLFIIIHLYFPKNKPRISSKPRRCSHCGCQVLRSSAAQHEARRRHAQSGGDDGDDDVTLR